MKMHCFNNLLLELYICEMVRIPEKLRVIKSVIQAFEKNEKKTQQMAVID